MCTYAEEAWHQEAYSEKEGGKFAEAGPPPVGSGVDTGVAGQVSQAHHPLRAARRHPRGLCAVGLFFNLLQPSLVRVLKGSLSSTLAIWPCDTPHRLATLQRPLRLFAGRSWRPTRKKSPIKQGPCWQPRFKRSRVKGAKSPITMVGRG